MRKSERLNIVTITEFLLARIAEDEERAIAAAGRGIVWARIADGVASHDVESGWHVLYWHPTRVLAECEAKRRIVTLWAQADDVYGGDAGVFMDDALTAVAAIYADHPDYQQEWSP